MAFTLRLLNLQYPADQALFIDLLNNFAMDNTAGLGQPLSPEILQRSLELFIQEPHAYSFIGEWNGEAVSLVNAYKIISTWNATYRLNLHDLVVAEKRRGQGFGRMTLEALETWCREQNIPCQTLEVLPENVPAVRLYESQGFEYTYNYMKKVISTPRPQPLEAHI
jgi:ribosomal protein S18 acetylase RimI-like enzyme